MAKQLGNPFAKEISEAEFQAEVIEKSREVPVVVDFWAEWCGPCRMLGPILERLAEEFHGAFVLAKVNTDENQALSASYGIRSIPNVKVFRDGKVADEMRGALPEHQVRVFLQRHCPSEADQLVAKAEQEDDEQAAKEALRLALEKDPKHNPAKVFLARLEIKAGELDSALEHLNAVTLGCAEYDGAETLKAEIEFRRTCRLAGGLDAAQQNVSANSADLGARFALASCLTAEGRYADALEEFLEIVRRDRNFRDEAARKAMLTIFSLVGERDPLTDQYRKRLASVLF